MLWLRTVVLFLHLVGAMFLVGELLLLALVVGPHARTLAPGDRRLLMQSIGRRSRPYAWSAVGLLVVTGLLNLLLMGIPLASLVTATFWRTPFGSTLGLKLLAVMALLGVMAAHDLASMRPGDRSGTQARLTPETLQRVRRVQLTLGRLSLLLALVVVILAARLSTLA